MKKLHENQVWTIYWHEDAECLHFIFQPYTKSMSRQEYLQELERYIAFTKQYRPKSIYADTREFYFTIAPDLQEYINKNILELYGIIGVKKHAILVSQDIFSALSIEQTMDENSQASYTNRYFESPQEAEKWLKLSTVYD